MVRYPDDVQAALDYAAAEGWTLERYQAVLAIALHHLETEDMPEPLVQYAEDTIKLSSYGDPVVAGEIYVACPLCGPVSWSVVSDGSAYDTFDAPALARNDAGEFTENVSYFLCGSCGMRYSVPGWLWTAGWYYFDDVEWGALVTDDVDEPAEVGE